MAYAFFKFLALIFLYFVSLPQISIPYIVAGKAIPITCCGDLYVCDKLRIPQCLDKRLADGNIASLTHQPLSTPS
jgi:hypothetical protein